MADVLDAPVFRVAISLISSHIENTPHFPAQAYSYTCLTNGVLFCFFIESF